jgi:hypothetical protein
MTQVNDRKLCGGFRRKRRVTFPGGKIQKTRFYARIVSTKKERLGLGLGPEWNEELWRSLV